MDEYVGRGWLDIVKLAGRCPSCRACVDTIKGERSLLTVAGRSETLFNFCLTMICRTSFESVSDGLSRRHDSFWVVSFVVVRWRSRLNANVATGCKLMNIFSRVVNCTRTTGQQWCLRGEKRLPKVSYRAFKAWGKKMCARRLLIHKQNS
jgi:hypothetical protein